MKTNLETFLVIALASWKRWVWRMLWGAIIEEHQDQFSASDDLPTEADPDLDALHSHAEIGKSLETKASCVDWQCAAPVGQCGGPQVHAID